MTDGKMDNPVSFYAALKKSDELLAHAYSKLYNIPSTGLRFYTVYEPAGPPERKVGEDGLPLPPYVVYNIGNSEEVTRLMPVLKEIGCTTVAITGKVASTLSKECDYRFIFPEFEEACYMHLAPTSSTTALLVLGDALAVVASRAINYTKEDFGLHHPAGALGKKLLVKVKDLMHSGEDNASVAIGTTLHKAIVEMSNKGLSMVNIVDADNMLKGIITDGDLRRMLYRKVDVYTETVDHLMTKTPITVDYRDMAINALQTMSDKKITCMPVLNEGGKVVGTIMMQDIFKAGIVR